MTDPRAAFDAAHARLVEAQADYMKLGPDHPLHDELDAALLEAGGSRLRRMKRNSRGRVDVTKASKVIGEDRMREIMTPFEARGRAIHADVSSRIDTAKADLNRLASLLTGADVRPGEDWLEVEWFYGATYRSSGDHYSRRAADLARIRLAHAAPRIETDVVDSPGGWTLRARVATPADVELLKRLPGPGLREEVRWCWANGMQPRVFNPFLPHGFEEREGLDYFGCDLRAEACPKCGRKHGGKA